jgi:murein DD-endopeptidase MepM/ murein hydrolase activator NlpD
MPHRLAPALLGLLVLLAAPAAGSASASPASTGDWRWPVDPPHPVVRQYLAPATPYGAGHRGIDIGSAGTGVFAPADGIVSFAAVVVDRPVLSIRHPGGIVSSYEPVQSTLKAGDAVSRGQPIGTLLPGHCTALCLHFGVRLDGEYVSPLNYLGEIPRSVLLPTREG